MITQKKDEAFHLLDQQLFNYRYGYIFYEKQLRKAFPKAEDLSLYPNKEDLIEKLSKLQNSTQLMAFVKNIKEDLNESKIFESHEGLTASEARRFLIKTITKSLEEGKNKLPTLVDQEADYEKARDLLEKSLTKTLDSLFCLNNGIEDISTGTGCPKRVLAKANDWALIKKWLDKEWRNKKITPIYKGSKDGMNATKFHEMCNNKGATITIIKSNHGKIFGGFLPESWTTRNNYVVTTKTWIFSLTAKGKYEMNDANQNTAAYDYTSYGPTWGGGHDIYLSSEFGSNTQNYCNKHSYKFPDNATLTGGYNFQVEEIEVFSIGGK